MQVLPALEYWLENESDVDIHQVFVFKVDTYQVTIGNVYPNVGWYNNEMLDRSCFSC